jgi:glycosyltransferase involved in cell wall biosynthesis
LENAMPRAGGRVGVVDGVRVIELALPYSNYLSLPRRTWVFLRYALHSIGVALTEDCDLVFASSTPLTASLPGIAARLLRGKPFVFEVRDLWPELPRAMGVIRNPLVLGMMSVLEWISYHSARGCIGLSPGIVAGIRRRGIAPERVAMIPNGCDLDLAKPRESEMLSLPGVAAGDFVAAFTGAHGVANGLEAILDAAAVLRQRGRNNIKLLFVGDGKLKPSLQKRARQEELSNCLFLYPVPKHQLFELMAQIHVGLMVLANVPAFYYGTSPNKFFDYIAAGLPVLNNYPGWLADLITEHQCGIAVAPDDPEAFADALERLAGDPDLRVRMGRNARRLAESTFDRDRHAQEFADFLEGVYARS